MITAKEKRDELIKKIMEEIEQKPMEWKQNWLSSGIGTAPKNGKSLRKYNGSNMMLLYCIQALNEYKDSRWYTFNQLQEMKASIKKDEKGTPVFFYREYDKLTKKEFDKATIENMSRDEAEKYMNENVAFYLKYYVVFNAEQCKNIPELASTVAMTEDEIKDKTNKVMESMLLKQHCPIIYGGDSSYYSPMTDEIHLPDKAQFNTMEDFYATALHEIAHSTGHQSRLNRKLDNKFGDENYAIEELRAELSSVFIQNDLNIEIHGEQYNNSLAYMQCWLKEIKEKPNVFIEAISSAEKISDYIKNNYIEESKSLKDFKVEAYTNNENRYTKSNEIVME